MNRAEVKQRLKVIGKPQWALAEAIGMNKLTLTSWMQCTEIDEEHAKIIEAGLKKLEEARKDNKE